jgi:hypothetical protein
MAGIITPEDQMRVVTSAPWVSEKTPTDRTTDELEITEYVQSPGFEQVAEARFMYFHRHLKVIIGDAHPGNFIKAEGVLIPIDLMIHEKR